MAVIIDGIEHVTAEDAAEVLKTTHLRVLMMLKEQSLVGRQINGTWYISRSSLACAEAHGSDKHNANGCHSFCNSSDCGCR